MTVAGKLGPLEWIRSSSKWIGTIRGHQDYFLALLRESGEHPGFWFISLIEKVGPIEKYLERPIAERGIALYFESIGLSVNSPLITWEIWQ